MGGYRGRFDPETHRTELPVRDGCSCCQALSDRIMELEDIANPIAAGFGRVRDHFNLTVREASLLMALLRFKRSLSKDELMTLSYPVETTRPQLKIIDVFVCKLRRKLPVELRPRTDWGMGYYLDSTARRGLQAIAGAGEHSDGGEESDTVIDFRKVRAAGGIHRGTINLPPIVVTPEASAIARKVFVEGGFAQRFVEDFVIPAAEIEQARHATDIVAR